MFARAKDRDHYCNILRPGVPESLLSSLADRKWGQRQTLLGREHYLYEL